MDAFILIVLAIILRLSAGVRYFVATCRGTVKPNPVTWLFWGIAPLIAALAQFQHGYTPATATTLALSLGPLAIFVAALRVKGRHWRIGAFDIACGAFAAVGIILWQITSDPVVALVFGILADIAGGIPTIRKAYIAPRTEESLPYMLSAASMVLTVCTVRDWQFINFGFPVYIFGINTLIALIIVARIRTTGKQYRKPTT